MGNDPARQLRRPRWASCCNPWPHADERGSIIAISDGAGNVTAINRYDEFGKPAAANAGRFQYGGQMWLSEAGLYHYKAHAYAPHLGRFLQADPIGYESGMNLYAYVGNDPVNRIDPLGLRGCSPEADVCGWRMRLDNSIDTVSANIGGPGGVSIPRQDNDADIVITARKRPKPGPPAPVAPVSPQRMPNPCGGGNLSLTIDGGVFLGYGGGFTLGLNFNFRTMTGSAFSSIRIGTGLGLIAGGGVGLNNSAPTAGASSSTNGAAGFGPIGGSLSFPSGGGAPSVSGGLSVGPKLGAELSKTDSLTNVINISGGNSACPR